MSESTPGRPDARRAVSASRAAGTPRATWADWALPAAVVLIGASAYRFLPPGVCFGDSGDLQAACATLGIAHAPGYGGFVPIGHLLTYFPGVADARVVTLGCLACGLGALLVTGLLLRSFGVSPLLASAAVLLLAAHPGVQRNLIEPEVYSPAWLLLVVSVASMLSFGHTASRSSLIISAAAYGLLCANRPPALLLAPFAAIALTIGWKSIGQMAPLRTVRKMRDVVIFAVAFGVPIAGSISYLLLRDDPALATNYIERCRMEGAPLPAADAGFAAGIERIVWLVSGSQFAGDVRGLGGDLDGRARQVLARLGVRTEWQLVVGALIVGGGLWALARRHLAAALMAFGILAAQWCYLLTYRVHDNALDVLPILFVLAVTIAVAASVVLAKLSNRWQAAAGASAFVGAIVAFGLAIREPPSVAAEISAEQFIHKLDIASLPRGTVIGAPWEHSGPLLYSCHITGRSDIKVRDLRSLLIPHSVGKGPILVTLAQVPAGFEAIPFRNIWRLEATVTPPPR